jgi:DNA-binding transcriptional LysR family regulator
VALNLFDMRSAEQFQALDDRKIDLGFVGLRPALSRQEMRSESVAQDTMLVAVSMDHPLAKELKIKLADLAPQFFIEMSAQTHPGSASMASLRPTGAPDSRRKILQEADTEMTAIKFVVDGLGVALMPEQITGLSHEGTVFLPLSPRPSSGNQPSRGVPTIPPSRSRITFKS